MWFNLPNDQAKARDSTKIDSFMAMTTKQKETKQYIAKKQ